MPRMDPRDFAERSRAALVAREAEWAWRMRTIYAPLREALYERIRTLQGTLPRLQAGSTVAATWQAYRLAAPLEQTWADEAHTARKAADLTIAAQTASLQGGSDDITAYSRTRAVTWSALSVAALISFIGYLGNGRSVEQHYLSLGAERLDTFRQTLALGVAAGDRPVSVARALTAVVDEYTLRRPTLIIQHESVRAYREGALQSLQHNSGVVDGWIWTCLLSPQSCATCIALDGTFHPLTEAFGSHTHCHCLPVPHLVTDVGPLFPQTGAEWFARQPQAVQEQILGPRKAALYRAGLLALADLVDRHDSPWGPTAGIKSMKQLVAEGTVHPDDVPRVSHQPAGSYPPVPPSGDAKGTPVSAALQLPAATSPNAAAIEHAIALIDSVHGDGTLPPTLVQSLAIPSPTTMGYFAPGASPFEIAIQRTGSHPHPVLTTLHEVGHLLDYSGLPGQGYASKSQQAVLADWWQAVYNSRRYQDLLADGSSFSQYLLRREELFARSYAQYIATKTGDADALQELQRLRSLSWLKAWNDDDFRPIAHAMEHLLRSQGWR